MYKFIKLHPELQEKYPLLRLLFNGTQPKTYEEIIDDKEAMKYNKSLEDGQKIESIYKVIIETDPILALTDRIVRNDDEAVSEYLKLHPTLLTEYKDEIEKLKVKYNFSPSFNKS